MNAVKRTTVNIHDAVQKNTLDKKKLKFSTKKSTKIDLWLISEV